MTIIRIVLTADNGFPEKLISTTKPRQKKGGHFLWKIKNELDEPAEITLHGFSPKGFVEIESTQPQTAPPGGQVLVLGKVIKARTIQTPVKYNVKVNGDDLDPELIIDGDGGNVPGPRMLKKGKRSGRKKR